jgi:hypothetical protein
MILRSILTPLGLWLGKESIQELKPGFVAGLRGPSLKVLRPRSNGKCNCNSETLAPVERVVWLRKQIVWGGVEAIEIFGVDVWVVFVLFACWIVSDVDELLIEVVGVSYAMFVIAVVPDFSWGLLAGCEGVASFDVLNAFCS